MLPNRWKKTLLEKDSFIGLLTLVVLCSVNLLLLQVSHPLHTRVRKENPLLCLFLFGLFEKGVLV